MSNQPDPRSPLWIVLYITLQLLWQQFLPGAVYVILPLSFAALFILTRIAHQREVERYRRLAPVADLARYYCAEEPIKSN